MPKRHFPDPNTRASFDGYAVDLRRSTRTYYMPNGETIELEMEPTPAPLVGVLLCL
jgi:hypothetical protein